MLTRLLQAIVITSTVYLIMMINQSPAQQPVVWVISQYPADKPADKVDRITHLFAEMMHFLLAPIQRG